MAIKYKVSKKINPLKPEEEGSYYANAISNGEVSLEHLIEIMAEKTRIHPVDCERFMLLLEETMVEQLRDGNIVRFGSIGNFQIGISSKGASLESKVTAKSITAAKVNFRVGKGLKKMLANLDFKKVK